jgi:glycosyltransferase involved in cell wall biosynthesis
LSISVVIPAFNAEATIGQALDGLASQNFDGEYEVIVVDDGSTDGTVRVASAARGPVTVLRQSHRGPAAARNRGVEHASGRVLAFTDADCTPSAGWLRAGVAGLDTADLVQGAVRPDPTADRTPFDRSLWVGEDDGLYQCASLFVRKEMFDRIGGFEDWLRARLGKQLAEDVWFGWRCRRAGATSTFAERALVDHAVLRRSASAYVMERCRRIYFPAMAAKIPELRDSFLYGRYFLAPSSAAFDLAVAGAAVSVLSSSAVPALLAAPYAISLGRRAIGWRSRAPMVAAVELLADAVGFGALLAGSARSRALVL